MDFRSIADKETVSGYFFVATLEEVGLMDMSVGPTRPMAPSRTRRKRVPLRDSSIPHRSEPRFYDAMISAILEVPDGPHLELVRSHNEAALYRFPEAATDVLSELTPARAEFAKSVIESITERMMRRPEIADRYKRGGVWSAILSVRGSALKAVPRRSGKEVHYWCCRTSMPSSHAHGKVNRPFETDLRKRASPACSATQWQRKRQKNVATPVMLQKGLLLEDSDLLLPWGTLESELAAIGKPTIHASGGVRTFSWPEARVLRGLSATVTAKNTRPRGLRDLELYIAGPTEPPAETFARTSSHLRSLFGPPTQGYEEVKDHTRRETWIMPPITITHAIAERFGNYHTMSIRHRGPLRHDPRSAA